MASALHSSASSDWGTPVEIVDWARALMGGIDLDPASSAERNKVVRATRFIDEQENGLTADWGGARNVLLNPPGERTGALVKAFWRRAERHVSSHTAVVWVGFSISQIRFTGGWPHLVFRTRVPFLDPAGVPAEHPTHNGFLALLAGVGRRDVAERFLATVQIGSWQCRSMEGR